MTEQILPVICFADSSKNKANKQEQTSMKESERRPRYESQKNVLRRVPQRHRLCRVRRRHDGAIRDKEYTYPGKTAHCAVCGSPVFAPEIVDANLRVLYEAYREKNGIIALDKFREIPAKYGLEKTELSLLLGWDAETFSRYYAGDIPAKDHSALLISLYHDTRFGAELLASHHKKTPEPS